MDAFPVEWKTRQVPLVGILLESFEFFRKEKNETEANQKKSKEFTKQTLDPSNREDVESLDHSSLNENNDPNPINSILETKAYDDQWKQKMSRINKKIQDALKEYTMSIQRDPNSRIPCIRYLCFEHNKTFQGMPLHNNMKTSPNKNPNHPTQTFNPSRLSSNQYHSYSNSSKTASKIDPHSSFSIERKKDNIQHFQKHGIGNSSKKLDLRTMFSKTVIPRLFLSLDKSQ